MVVRICRFDGGNCDFSSCSFLDSSGKVRVCERHGNPSGFYACRVRGFSSVPVIYNKHLHGDVSKVGLS